MCGVISNFSTWQMWRFLRFIHMWRNFRFLHTADVEKYEISPHVACVWCKNVNTNAKFKLFCYKISCFAIYAILSRNCCAVIYALLCGEKFIKKLHLCRKNDKYEVWVHCWTEKAFKTLLFPSDVFPKRECFIVKQEEWEQFYKWCMATLNLDNSTDTSVFHKTQAGWNKIPSLAGKMNPSKN